MSGPPSIRVLGPIKVVAGSNTTLHCPYAGYPVKYVLKVLYFTA